MEVNGLNIQNGHKMLIQPMQVIHGLTFRKKEEDGGGEGGWRWVALNTNWKDLFFAKENKWKTHLISSFYFLELLKTWQQIK